MNDIHNAVSLFTPPESIECMVDHASYKRVITDRGSKYTVTGGRVTGRDDAKRFVKELCKDSTFRKASHNSFARRVNDEHRGIGILEGKNDDGETGAGMCILRELQRAQYVNIVVVVTRYYGGVKLMNDRFKHVVDATRIFLKKIRQAGKFPSRVYS